MLRFLKTTAQQVLGLPTVANESVVVRIDRAHVRHSLSYRPMYRMQPVAPVDVATTAAAKSQIPLR